MTARAPLSGCCTDLPRLKSWRQAVVLSLIAGHDEPISAKELARIMGAGLGAVAHHFRGLAAAGMLDRVEERRAGGVVETFYVVSAKGRRALQRPRVEALLVLAGAVGMAQVDEHGWRELDQLAESLRPQIARIFEAAGARRRPARRA